MLQSDGRNGDYRELMMLRAMDLTENSVSEPS